MAALGLQIKKAGKEGAIKRNTIVGTGEALAMSQTKGSNRPPLKVQPRTGKGGKSPCKGKGLAVKESVLYLVFAKKVLRSAWEIAEGRDTGGRIESSSREGDHSSGLKKKKGLWQVETKGRPVCCAGILSRVIPRQNRGGDPRCLSEGGELTGMYTSSA